MLTNMCHFGIIVCERWRRGMTLKEIRTSKNLTQKQAAELCGIPLRTYVRYELEDTKEGSLKYKYIVSTLNDYGYIDEEHGVLTFETIVKIVDETFAKYDVEYCYLFGSYAKGKATEKSDVDLFISTTLTGIRFFGLVEELRTALHKKVDLLTLNQLNNNNELINEIFKDGIKIYG